ncbi:hypothetical protein PVAG01_03221 [Phlyctema vagabunda]|uniref:Major facilitator superfamily (MFS) profile domain-containing protein n=1 Tax=Phlyctema vagabunda TaxID=108571 RepID=A0ABR4PST3_9HELO
MSRYLQRNQSRCEDEFVPGTVYILNEDHISGTAYTSKDIILRPTPSSDPEDPLRWPRWRKLLLVFFLVCYSSVLGAVSNWDGTIYASLLVEYKTTVFKLNLGAAFMILMLGIGNIFFTPLADVMGRRFVYITSSLIVMLANMWLALSNNIIDSILAKTLLGFGAAPFEALPVISISDTFFAHERGTMMGAYVFGLAFGSFIGPICAGYMAVAHGWRMVYWLGVCISGAVALMIVIFMEETIFHRPEDLSEDNVAACHNPKLFEDDRPSSNDKSDKIPEPAQDVEEGVGEVFDVRKFRLFSPLWKLSPCSPGVFIERLWRPLTVCTFPAVIWGGINYGTCVSWLSVLATTESLIFSAPPYGFSPSTLGLFFISPMIGSLIGAYFAGPLNDWLSLYLSSRNNNTREPEYRLWAFVPAAIIMPGGLVIYGVTAAHGLEWIVPVVGMGMVGFGLSVGGSVTMAYIVDCYKDLAGEVVTTIILIRNIVGFALTFAIQPWIDRSGLQNTFITIGCLSFAITIFAVFFIVMGKSIRLWTKDRYLNFKK